MNYLSKILEKYKKSNTLLRLLDFMDEKSSPKVQLDGLIGSQYAFFLSALYKKINKNIVLIMQDNKEAFELYDNLSHFFNKEQLLFYPNFSYQPYRYLEESINRSEALAKIFSLEGPYILLLSAESALEKVTKKTYFLENILHIKKGESIELNFLNEFLSKEGFEKVSFVSKIGEYAIRGSIVDVFSFGNSTPFRIEFFADEIESIRSFDINTQLSLKKLDKIRILADLREKNHPKESLLEQIPLRVIFMKNTSSILDSLDNLFKEVQGNINSSLNQTYLLSEKDFISPSYLLSLLEKSSLVQVNKRAYFTNDLELKITSEPQPSFNKQFPLLIENLETNTKEGYINYLACVNQKQLDRFYSIFEDLESNVSIHPIIASFSEGFIDKDQKIVFYTDHQIFDRFHRSSFYKRSKNFGFTLKELNALKKGDYISHIDHGIGQFDGLMKIDIAGKQQEAIKIIYQDNDLLYVSIHSLYKIAKYTPKEGTSPRLNKLGSNNWKSLKNRAKSKLKQVAFNLVELYAKRKLHKGFSFGEDSYLQNHLEASFLYEETPDQLCAIEQVKKDMESSTSMDRLICADVGFGKTEIALRGAFKAVSSNKQVVMLVPTTILAFQHYRTFSERFKGFPLRVDYLNRFRSQKDKKAILKDLELGNIDIIIATHQLINHPKFKDLGLLIIDEEHKFGVNIKDKIKTFCEHIDILTLSATPIPRTLQFSLIGARDFSLIKTPPANRRPIETQLISFDIKRIKEAINYELSRGGQVFFIHNKVKDLEKIHSYLKEAMGDLKIGIGHGQMKGVELEGLMLDFIQGNIDLLLSTTIIESGLDVPNANTIFINEAQNFGLADLHQIRGRVGRSNTQAFCYLITPPLSSLSEGSSKRLRALEEFSDLGAGFQIAMKDLEIRGAGNLLGAEQSGFIAEMGFETYQKILDEVMQEIKINEFDHLSESFIKEEKYATDVQIDTDMELLIPDEYINNTNERLILYQKLTQIKNQEELDSFKEALCDRFGAIPPQTEDLLSSIELKWLAMPLGFIKLVLKKEIMFCYFTNHPSYFKGVIFESILEYIKNHADRITLKEKIKTQKQLFLCIKEIDTLDKALSWIKRLYEKVYVSYKKV